MSDVGLKADGERFLPEFSGIIELEHYHRYFVARGLAVNKDVLDIASGEGFGSNILSKVAKSVKGVDISKEAVDHALATYANSNLSFVVGSATDIPLGDNEVDVVVSFETIEHLVEHERMISEIKRVMRPDGMLIISSPNKLVYSDQANYKNPFHLKELYTEEFLGLIFSKFVNVNHYSQRVTTSSAIVGQNEMRGFTTYQRNAQFNGLPNQTYDIIVATDGELPKINNSIFEDVDSDLQPHKIEEHNAKLADKKNLTTGNARLNAALSKALRDNFMITNDKWWRWTSSLRNLSNTLKRLRGKSPKVWPKNFDLNSFIESTSVDEINTSLRNTPSFQGYNRDIPLVNYTDVREDFVAEVAIGQLETVPKTIAFYLPQFHPFPENDVWWGKGFTEWTNVGKAKPVFYNHYQPHCPIHLGYYDLRISGIMEEQAALARAHGISGFAYYFYWFAGKVLMEQPLQKMLENSKVDIPFCMIWANENWTRRWDGQENDVLIAQQHSLEDSGALLAYLQPFLKDPRYIKINGKPLFIIYRSDIIPNMKDTINLWRAQVRSFGFPDLYIVCAQTFGHGDPRDCGFDAAMEFPPHGVKSEKVANELEALDPAFDGAIYDYDQVVTSAVRSSDADYKVFPTAMLSWDNTARKKNRSTIFANFTVARYAQWLSANLERVAGNNLLSLDEKIVFVNAWNEWAEGTHLEPDQKHGFGYLAATKSVMENYSKRSPVKFNPNFVRTNGVTIAIIAHVHYSHTWEDLRAAINQINDQIFDIYITVTSLAIAELILNDFPAANVELVDNRGRDIRPFIYTLGKIINLGYILICKVHGKASTYRSDGDHLRRSSLNALLTTASIRRFDQQPKLGMLVESTSLIEHTIKNMTYSGKITEVVAGELKLKKWRGRFPAGSMFWFRPAALNRLTSLKLNDFDLERGLADGTRAHAIERLFCVVCEADGFEVAATVEDTEKI